MEHRKAKSHPPGNAGPAFCPFCSPTPSLALPPRVAGLNCPGTTLASHAASSVPPGMSLQTTQLQPQTQMPPRLHICQYMYIASMHTYIHTCMYIYMYVVYTHTLCMSHSCIH